MKHFNKIKNPVLTCEMQGTAAILNGKGGLEYTVLQNNRIMIEDPTARAGKRTIVRPPKHNRYKMQERPKTLTRSELIVISDIK